MRILETDRLVLREATLEDAGFFLELVNDPSWKRFIGDSRVRTLADASGYIERGLLASYEQNGFGLWVVEEASSGTPAGICGLIRRPTLDDVDLGFAFLPNFCGRGYATEAGSAVRDLAWKTFGLPRLVAITSPDNAASIHVLEKLGFSFERMLEGEVGERASKLFGLSAPKP